MAHAKNRRVPIETLKGVRETFQRTEEERRRLELEGRLYKKWRYGFCEDSVLLEAKSNHEALAKMNWMDIQVQYIIMIWIIFFYQAVFID